MEYGFIKVATATPKVKVANPKHNSEQIVKLIKQSREEKVEILVFPELCITGYTCGDLFLQDVLINSAKEALLSIVKQTKSVDILVVLGLPLMKGFKLYNVAALIKGGKILGIIPKKNIPNHGDINESRYFTSGNIKPEITDIDGLKIPFGTNILLRCESLDNLSISVEIGEDLWAPKSPSTNHSLNGGILVLNPSASPRTIGKAKYRRELVCMQSAKLISGYIQADAGEGESTTDLVFSGHNIIAENGTVLAESHSKYNELLITEIDIEKLNSERKRNSFYQLTRDSKDEDYSIVDFSYSNKNGESVLTREITSSPFIPHNKEERDDRLAEILNIQALGLKKRLEHIGTKRAILGLSGGLDSTLALLVTKKAFDFLGLEVEGIVCVTMPCFGTTDRTYDNALKLAKHIGASLLEIPIEDAVIQHFKDIGHDINNHDITYENAQARERTQVLMDISNKYGGIVIGTGDLSELCLGWATYNGDHMSMYGVNTSIPKTLVRYLVKYWGDTTDNKELKAVLFDILDTPVSPELLPPVDGEIAQKTEDIVGPYELHDFFLYYILRFGFMPSKIYYLARIAFEGKYDEKTIYKWLTNFYGRFFSQQFKRSCLPDGPKVGTVGVSPRGELIMPSDANVQVWLEDLQKCRPD